MTTPAPPHPAIAAAAAAPPWHLARSLAALKAGVDAHWPGRSKASDGGIGNAAHQAEGSGSDHNPWLSSSLGPAVRAYDLTADGIDAPWLAELLRGAGAAGDDRLVGGSGNVDDNGYVIWNGHITAPDFSRWVVYNGSDPHTSHVHVSVTRDPNGFEDGRPWSFLAAGDAHPGGPVPATGGQGPVGQAPVPPAPDGQVPATAGPHPGNTATQAPAPVLDPDGPEPDGYAPPGADATGTGPDFRAQYGNNGPNVKRLQVELNRDAPIYSGIAEDGDYGPETAGVVQDFARRVAADPSCPEQYRAALAGAHGDNVGPNLAAVFPLYGIHV